MKIPLSLIFNQVKGDPSNVNNLRYSYACWQKRERSEPLDMEAWEPELAEEFESLWREAMRSEDPRKIRNFTKQLLKTFAPRKFRLIDAIVEEAPKHNTREEIRAAIDLKYPGEWKDGAWKKAWKVFFGDP